MALLIFLSLPGHGMSGFALPYAFKMMCCLDTTPKTVKKDKIDFLAL